MDHTILRQSFFTKEEGYNERSSIFYVCHVKISAGRKSAGEREFTFRPSPGKVFNLASTETISASRAATVSFFFKSNSNIDTVNRVRLDTRIARSSEESH